MIFDIIQQTFGKRKTAKIKPVCNYGSIFIFEIVFDSNTEMQLIQDEIIAEETR